MLVMMEYVWKIRDQLKKGSTDYEELLELLGDEKPEKNRPAHFYSYHLFFYSFTPLLIKVNELYQWNIKINTKSICNPCWSLDSYN